MTCGCIATINEKDERAPLWRYIFGRLEFPIVGPFMQEMGSVVGLGYRGDASALTEDKRKRLGEKMIEKFKITQEDVDTALKDGIVPIKAEGIVVSICAGHAMMVALDSEEEEAESDDWAEDEDI